jgi:hypothetical protein
MKMQSNQVVDANNDNEGGNKNLNIHEINEKWELGLKQLDIGWRSLD